MDHLLEDQGFQKKLMELSERLNITLDQARADAERYLKELYTTQSPMMDALAVEGSQYILGRAYDKTIDVNPDEMKALSKLMRRNSVAFVMTHKTYIDMMVLGCVLARHGLPVPHIFAGINMAFLGVGEIGRKAGVIFIRRSFKDNPIYKICLRHFVASRVNERAHFMWAIEGTRSRTGKLVWPKMGILKYIVEAERQSTDEVKYVPVSVVYDLIPDVDDMTQEGRGKEKKPENLLWFLNYIRKMGDNYGKISIRFGDPIKMSDEGVAEIPDDEDYDPKIKYHLPKFAFELIHGINQVTPVTTASLICTSLLSKFALTKSSLESDVISLMHLIENQKPDVLVDRGKQIGASVQDAINLLKNADLIQQLGEGVKAKYAIVTRNFLSATYYANMAAHHLYRGAFIELALCQILDAPKEERNYRFWEEIMDIRDLFKFEFFYSRKDVFTDEIERDLDYLDQDWREKLSGSKTELKKLLSNQGILVSQAVLSIYLEAYQVVARALLSIDRDVEISEQNLLHACMFLGDELHWRGRIHRIESVSKPLIINGIRLVKNLDLIPTMEDDKEEEISAFIEKLRKLSSHIETLQDMVMKKTRKGAKIIPIDQKLVPGSKTGGMTSMVVEGESGAHIGAFFDLDRTLIRGFSAKQFFQSRLLSGKMSAREVVAQFSGVMVYAIGNKNFAGLAAISAKGVKGTKEQVFIEVGEEVYYKYLAQEIYPESRSLVDAHLAKGHTVAIISAATPYQVNPIARDLGVEHVMCTRMEVKNGLFTGDIVEPACWGDGKALAAKDLAHRHGLDLDKSYFYTDSAEDLPLLEIVGHPRPVNPDNELSSIAYRNDWPVYRFNDEKRPLVSNVARTIMAFGSIFPAAAVGAFSGLTSASWRDGINSMIGSVGDIGTRLAGMNVVVKGEEHIWSQRPGVFLFNHQSNSDFLIMAKLLKKDVVAIAKKELEMSPIGPFFKAAGVIFIDRKNKEKAIQAMQPAVDALKKGTSIAIAPEGTRSYDYTLGPFKKGAFHLAMQAGVPIIPIVIKNAHDIMARGSALLQPGLVEVVVLPPVSTDKWTKANLSKKIDMVRKQYLDELGQEDNYALKSLPDGAKKRS